MGAERRGRSQQVVCYRSEASTGGLCLEERKEVKVCSQPIHFPGWSLFDNSGCCCMTMIARQRTRQILVLIALIDPGKI